MKSRFKYVNKAILFSSSTWSWKFYKPLPSGIDYWPDLENEIVWSAFIGENEKFGSVVGKVWPGENPSVLTPVALLVPRIWASRGFRYGLDPIFHSD